MKHFFIFLVTLLSSFYCHANTDIQAIYDSRAPLPPETLEEVENVLHDKWGNLWATYQPQLPEQAQQQHQLLYALLCISRSSKRYVALEKLLRTSELALIYSQQIDSGYLYADALLQRGRIVGIYQEQLEQASELTQQALQITSGLIKQPAESHRAQVLHQEVLAQMGKILSHNARHDAALPYLNQALSLAQELDNQHEQVSLLNAIGAAYRQSGNMEKQLEYQYQALTIAQSQQLPSLEADALRNIGLTYKHLQNFDKAIEHLNQALTIYRSLKRERRVAKTLNYLGSTFAEMQRFQQAVAVYLDALSLYQAQNYHYGAALLSYNLAEAYSELGEQQRAQHYNNQAIELFMHIGHNAYLRASYLQAVEIQTQQSNQKVAANYALKAMQLLPEKANVQQLREVRQIAADILASSGHHSELRALLEQELDAVNLEHNQTTPSLDIIKTKHEQQRLLNQLSKTDRALQAAEQQATRYFNSIRWAVVAALSLLLFALWQTLRLRRQKQLTKQAKLKLRIAPATGLENSTSLPHKLHPRLLEMVRQWELWYSSDRKTTLPNRCQFILVYSEFMDGLYHQVGLHKGRIIEHDFGQYVIDKFGGQAQLVQLRDNTLFIVAESESASELAKNTLHTLHDFTTRHALDNPPFSLALIDFPFLPRSGRAVGEQLINEILLLALHGARQLSSKFSESAWVKFNAIDATPTSFLSQKPRQNIVNGIEKGYIKIESSHDRQEICWPHEQPEC